MVPDSPDTLVLLPFTPVLPTESAQWEGAGVWSDLCINKRITKFSLQSLIAGDDVGEGEKAQYDSQAQGAYAIRKDLSTWKLSPFELAWETINMEPNKVILTESFFRVELLSNHLWCSSLDVPGLYWYHPGAEVHWTVYSIIVFPVLC